jgi:hypothetical protein
MFWRDLSHNISLIFVSALCVVGCQGASKNASCSKPKAVSSGKIAKSEYLGGGVLTLEGMSIAPGSENKRSSAQCSAYVRVLNKSGSSYSSQIWTARHCLPDFTSRIVSNSLHLYDGEKGYVQVELQLPLAQTRASFFELVEAKIPEFQDDEKKQKHPARIVMNYTFLEEEGKKNYGEDCQSGQRGAAVSSTLLCSALQDFRIFDASLTPKTRVGGEILTGLLARETERARGGADNSLIAQWQSVIKQQMELELDISRARFVDTILQCQEKTPSAVCPFLETVRVLAQKHRAPGRDLLAEAQRDGFQSPGKSYSEFKKNLAQENYTKKLLPLFSRLQSAIESGSLSLIFAGNFADEAGKTRLFASAPLKDFYATQPNMLKFSFATAPARRDALVKFESPPERSLVLGKGDSGSALMLDSSTPFLVLSAKGTESISGGSAILALPEVSEDEPIVARPIATSCK